MSTSQANTEAAACIPVQNDCTCVLNGFLNTCAGWVLTNIQGGASWVRFTTLHTYEYCTSENGDEHKSSK